MTNGLDSYSVVLSAQERSGVRFVPRRELQKDSCEAAQGKCSFPWDGIGMANETPARFYQAVCKTAIAPERCIIAPFILKGQFRHGEIIFDYEQKRAAIFYAKSAALWVKYSVVICSFNPGLPVLSFLQNAMVYGNIWFWSCDRNQQPIFNKLFNAQSNPRVTDSKLIFPQHLSDKLCLFKFIF